MISTAHIHLASSTPNEMWPTYQKYEHVYNLTPMSNGPSSPPIAWRATGTTDKCRSTRGKTVGWISPLSARSEDVKLALSHPASVAFFAVSGKASSDGFSTNATSSTARNFPGLTLLRKGLFLSISSTNVQVVSNHSTVKPSTSS